MFGRGYMAGILPIRRKTQNNQSINLNVSEIILDLLQEGYNLVIRDKKLKLHLAYLPNFFKMYRVLNHNKYVEINQFSKVDIKQNNISTVILLIKFLVHQGDPRHWQGSRVVYIFIYTLYSCSI